MNEDNELYELKLSPSYETESFDIRIDANWLTAGDIVTSVDSSGNTLEYTVSNETSFTIQAPLKTYNNESTIIDNIVLDEYGNITGYGLTPFIQRSWDDYTDEDIDLKYLPQFRYIAPFESESIDISSIESGIESGIENVSDYQKRGFISQLSNDWTQQYGGTLTLEVMEKWVDEIWDQHVKGTKKESARIDILDFSNHKNITDYYG